MSGPVAKPLPGDLLEGCVVVLAICREWLRRNHPDASVNAEIEENEWHEIALVPSIEKLLTAYRDEYGTEEDL